jgi:hypothetical protein
MKMMVGLIAGGDHGALLTKRPPALSPSLSSYLLWQSFFLLHSWLGRHCVRPQYFGFALLAGKIWRSGRQSPRRRPDLRLLRRRTQKAQL